MKRIDGKNNWYCGWAMIDSLGVLDVSDLLFKMRDDMERKKCVT